MPENIIIPSVYNGTSVTQIASQGFKNCIKLKKVTISKGIKTIANEAFSGCENLEEVILPNSLSTIGMLAFTGTKISEIVLPNSIRIIADFAFAGCDHLTTLIIDIGLHSIGMSAFTGTRISKIYYKGPESIWSQISVGEENDQFLNSDCYFYSENKPTKQGNYWHYDEDGKTPVIWSNED